MNQFVKNIGKLHTTELGVLRIKCNLNIDTDVVEYCKNKITNKSAIITRKGKNWYIKLDDCVITVNALSFTIITAHKKSV